jgi:CBS domain-containing protein
VTAVIVAAINRRARHDGRTAERRDAMMATDPTIREGDLCVADLMTIDPITVAIDATIEESEDLMRRHRVSGLPVVDEAGRLMGVISQTDILYLDVPAVRDLIRHRARGIRVGEVMSAPPVTIDANASLQDAAIRMHTERIHRLVAVDDHGRPIGVISAMDFVTLAAEG